MKKRTIIIDQGETIRYGYNDEEKCKEIKDLEKYDKEETKEREINWKIFEENMRNILTTDEEKKNVIITEKPFSLEIDQDYKIWDKKYQQKRENMTKILFENNNVELLYLVTDATLSLYSTGKTSGLVFDLGSENSYCVPIVDGYCHRNALRTNISANTINNYIRDVVQSNTVNIDNNFIDYKKNCITSSTPIKYLSNDNKSYKLPDGNTVFVPDYSNIPEIYFQPSLFSLKSSSLSSLYSHILSSSHNESHQICSESIVLTGSSSLYKNFNNRLLSELKPLVKSCYTTKIYSLAPDLLPSSVWIGGCILSSLSSFSPLMLSRQEYSEGGVSMVHRKCY